MIRRLTYFIEFYKLPCISIFYFTVVASLVLLSTRYFGASPHPPVQAPPSLSDAIMARETVKSAPTGSIGIPGQATTASAVAGTSVWPIHGKVTTEFGAPDFPFQSHHTGIDISSAHPSGATSVQAFRSGTVTQVIHSGSGYGNHVIINHGGGITSLYGHLYSISVFQGEQVMAGQIIGTEGSTGASTGTHLHFEIRTNGTPQNPRHFLIGNP